MIESGADELRKFTQVETCILFLIFQYHFFNAIKTIKDEMWIHLRVKTFYFKFRKLLIYISFLMYPVDPATVNNINTRQ